MIHILSTIALLGFGTAAAMSDLRSRRIPNVLTATLLATALVLRIFAGTGALLEGLSGAGVALALVLPLFIIGAIGGGDGKLLIGFGAMLGTDGLWVALLAIALVGGVMATIEMVRRRAVVSTLLGVHSLVTAPDPVSGWKTIRTPGSVTIPYGIAIAIGAAVGWFL